MGSRSAEVVWVLVVVVACWAAPRPSCPCPYSLLEAAPTASGYLPINETTGSKMFFAYYEASENISRSETHTENDDADGIPILLWLQGGPGCSSMIGNFYELGPWRVGEDQCLYPNPGPWNRIFGLLFLDNPVGAGFSIAPLLEDIPTDKDGVARDVYTALEGFYDLFPALLNRPFCVTGESYAGKYVPAVATYILDKQGTSCHFQRQSTGQLRLDGIAIGNGVTHPIAQVEVHAPIAYFMGLIDENQKEALDAIAARVVALIEEENWVDARHARGELLHHLENVTGLATLSDVRKTRSYYSTANGTDYLTPFMNKEEVQQSLLHTEPITWKDCNDVVGKRMASDVMKSTMPIVESLLNQSVPVLLYQGQFDLRDGVASTEAWIQLLQWDGLKGFYASERMVWKENNVKVGYVRSYGSLTHVVVSNAGHLVPADQAFASQRMVEKWVSGVGLV